MPGGELPLVASASSVVGGNGFSTTAIWCGPSCVSGQVDQYKKARPQCLCGSKGRGHGLLYIPALPGADFNPTDHGISDEIGALELALCLYYRPPLPPPPPVYSTPAQLAGSQYTDEELEALLED